MTKRILLSFLLFIVSYIVIAQESEQDSSSLKSSSQSLLKRDVTFYHPEGSLESALYKLSIEQNIKLSYSDDKINKVFVKEAYYSSVELGLLLNFLLQHTGFRYIVVGRIIVLVEDKTISSDVPHSDTTSASSTTTRTPSDTIGVPVDTAPATSDSSARPEKHVGANPIYSPDANLSMLSTKERKRIQQLYKKELAWSRRNKRIFASHISIHDTLPESQTIPLPDIYNRHLDNFKYYVSGRVGLVKYLPRIRDNSNYAWEQELNFDHKVNTSFYPAIGFGLVRKHFLIGTGIGYYRLTQEGEGRAIYPKGKSAKADTVNISFSDRYSVVSIPLEVLFFKQKRSLFIGAGLAMEMDLIGSKNTQRNKFQSYYSEKKDNAMYHEKNSRVAIVGSLKVLAGLLLQPGMVLSSSVEYNYYINPITKNSLYSFYPNSLEFKISFFYFLSKSDLKRVFTK